MNNEVQWSKNISNPIVKVNCPLFVDASGSCRPLIEKATSFIQVDPKLVTYFDVEIRTGLNGSGMGTDFRVVIEEAKKLGHKEIAIFTDGYINANYDIPKGLQITWLIPKSCGSTEGLPGKVKVLELL